MDFVSNVSHTNCGRLDSHKIYTSPGGALGDEVIAPQFLNVTQLSINRKGCDDW